MIVVSMSEFDLHDRWDKLEAVMPRPPHPHFSYARPSEYLLGAFRAGLLTFDQALEMYLCCIGVAVAL